MGLEYCKQVLKSLQQQVTNNKTKQYLHVSYKYQNSSKLNKSHILITFQVSAKHTSVGKERKQKNTGF